MKSSKYVPLRSCRENPTTSRNARFSSWLRSWGRRMGEVDVTGVRLRDIRTDMGVSRNGGYPKMDGLFHGKSDL